MTDSQHVCFEGDIRTFTLLDIIYRWSGEEEICPICQRRGRPILTACKHEKIDPETNVCVICLEIINP